MGQPFDRYSSLGLKQAASSLDDSSEKVRAIWPGADCEGSTGQERTYAVRTDDGVLLVGHAWAPRKRWNVRIAKPGAGLPI